MKTALAITIHDPAGRMLAQARRAIPILVEIFPRIALRASHSSDARILDAFKDVGAQVDHSPGQAAEGEKLGLARRAALALGLQSGLPSILYCDGDRALHWAEYYPAELAQVARQITGLDFTVLGRTERAFLTHPDVQRDTEQIINRVFCLVSGLDWDVGAGARGLSRRAAETILQGCPDENLSTDVSWPLYLRSLDSFKLGYLATQGLEFETPDRYTEEIEAAGGLHAWLSAFDSDPQRWLDRLELAGGHLRAMLQYGT